MQDGRTDIHKSSNPTRQSLDRAILEPEVVPEHDCDCHDRGDKPGEKIRGDGSVLPDGRVGEGLPFLKSIDEVLNQHYGSTFPFCKSERLSPPVY